MESRLLNFARLDSKLKCNVWGWQKARAWETLWFNHQTKLKVNQYKHLTRQDRYAIEVMLRNPSRQSQSTIAAALGVDAGTISREIRRDGMTRETY